MKMRRLINVFLSSTFLDLREHRECILKGMRRLQWVDARCMESEPPPSRLLLAHCLRMVEECQVYVGVFGARYGAKIDGISLTEHELNRATELRLYRVLLLSEQVDKTRVDDPEALDRLREKVGTWYPDYFDEGNPESPAVAVATALSNAWFELGGCMEIAVAAPWEMYLHNPQGLFELRKCIAADAGVEDPGRVWLTGPHDVPDPQTTIFRCFLPNANKLLYLGSRGPRSGGVRWARLVELNALGVVSEVACEVYAHLYKVSARVAGFWPASLRGHGLPKAESRRTPTTSLRGANNMNEHNDLNLTRKSAANTAIPIDPTRVPIIAFFGTKGGVGKTTIMDKCATLIARGASGPNVLLVDFDVHHRGLTVLRTKDRPGACKTVHEYLADGNLGFSTALDVTLPGDTTTCGKQFLIPSSNLAAEHVFKTLADTDPRDLLDRIRDVINAATEIHAVDAVLIDCGPIVDPLTASAAYLSDMAFIIGQNEPISFQALQNYAIRIRDFLPDFDASAVRVILNKVRGPVFQRGSIYAVIPFTLEVVDYSEGLPNIDEVRLVYLDYCVYGILKRLFETTYPKLVPGPEAVFTAGQRKAVETISRYSESRWYSRCKSGARALYLGCIAIMIGVLLIVAPKMIAGQRAADVPRDATIVSTQPASRADERKEGSAPTGLEGDSFAYGSAPWIGSVAIGVGVILAGVGGFSWRRLRQAAGIIRLRQVGGHEALLELLTSKRGRQKFSAIQILSDKTEKELRR